MFRQSTVLVVYVTKHGSSRRIAQRLADGVTRTGATAELVDLADIGDRDPADYSAVVVAAAVHAGHHPREVGRWVHQHRAAFDDDGTPLVLISVSLTAAAPTDPDYATAMAAQAADLVDACGFQPALLEHVAGALQFDRYGLATRMMMRKIAKAKGLLHDAHGTTEYTDWDQVGEIARAVVALAERGTQTQAA